ncbi:DUF4142 domain-containing protein [Sphingomonas quercus]|uniref:DUF4142 domain-containing protein n=1 Tax=Sphingomonas quercus TaxID=2842451 RepID=A0ABS6BJ81_9SPHN|nr:DUF4142 domain-containing protein [Sphingomonas quercus]MBU3078358.1 DUF4142 domain-containing protein [Sphingomonas quercus]
MRTALVLIAALGLAACGSQPAQNNTVAADNGMTANAMDGNSAMADATAPSVTANVTTPEFVTKAAISDMYEIQAAKVALDRSKSAEVKSFAQMMVTDHTATSAKVKSIVTKDKLDPPPAALDEAHAKMLADLKAAKAEDFDTTYLDQQTTAHGEALSLLQSYASGGDNADLKAFATETAPKVQMHLDKARSLDRSGADDKAAAKPAQ